MFLMSATGKASQNLRFYRHLSRCIVFFGLPRRDREHRKEIDPKAEHDMKMEPEVKLDG
jgi:hypothetical protein